MFSQYSWWDFIKFILVLAVPYYALVLWKYYRQDIRELILNRGKNPLPAPVPSSDEDEEDEDELVTSLYDVKTYADQPAVSVPAPKGGGNVAGTAVQPQPLSEPEPMQRQTNNQPETDIPEGVVVDEDIMTGFDIVLLAEVVRPAERSLADVINAARRLVADEAGSLSAKDSNDGEAAEVASVLNEQRGFGSVLSGVSFNR